MNVLTKCRIVPSCGGLLLLPVVLYLIMVLLFRDSRNTVILQEQSCDIEMLSVLKESEMALYQKCYRDIQAIGGGDWTFKSTRQCLDINSEFYIRSIDGRRISWVQHKSDIVRLHILKEYGGIYCDTDQIILRSLNVFRNNECTMGNAHDGSLGSALILAAKNSQFINKWIESYISYDPTKWGDNSVTMAMKLAKENKDLIEVQDHHCVFFPHAMILYNQNYKWSHSYGLHVYKLGHIEELKRLNFTNIRRLNSTIGAVIRYILYGNKEMCE
ncbi:uncharacterized protein LOC133194797 isoform X2 [Saccostrea echinata]|uniref:uncharacterized protein LOC133194797 isoform X2 n=1 Tax=Saccostrea echinata TaxID=191078 RepID=UPI002A7EC05A|nr:uncharacterized protein LOC133194797 isoform X2 [Saccostrea echinata]